MVELQSSPPRSRRPRPQAVRLTEAAAARIRQLTEAASGPCAGLRIGVKNGGCAGQEYTVEYADRIEPLDEVVEDKGATVLIDPKAILFLIGSEIDFLTPWLRHFLGFLGITDVEIIAADGIMGIDGEQKIEAAAQTIETLAA